MPRISRRNPASCTLMGTDAPPRGPSSPHPGANTTAAALRTPCRGRSSAAEVNRAAGLPALQHALLGAFAANAGRAGSLRVVRLVVGYFVYFVVAVPARIEQQRHQRATDQQRKKDA